MKRILVASLLIVAGFAYAIAQLHQGYAAGPLPGAAAAAIRPTPATRTIAPNAVRGGGPTRTVTPTPVTNFPFLPPQQVTIDPTGFKWFNWSVPGQSGPGGFFGPGGGGGGGGGAGGPLVFNAGITANPGGVLNVEQAFIVVPGMTTIVSATVQIVSTLFTGEDVTNDIRVGITGNTLVLSDDGDDIVVPFLPNEFFEWDGFEEIHWFAVGF